MKRWWIAIVVFFVLAAVVAAIWSAQRGIEPTGDTGDAISSDPASISVSDPAGASYYQERLIDERQFQAKSDSMMSWYGEALVRLTPDSSGNLKFQDVIRGEFVDFVYRPQSSVDVFTFYDQHLFCAYYSPEQKRIAVDCYEKDGTLQSTVLLEDSKVKVLQERYANLKKIRVSEQYIYVFGTPEGGFKPDLEVYDRSGTLLRRVENVSDGDAYGDYYAVCIGTGPLTTRINLRETSSDHLLISIPLDFINITFSRDGTTVCGLERGTGHFGTLSIASEGADYARRVWSGTDTSYIPYEGNFVREINYDTGRFWMSLVTSSGGADTRVQWYAYDEVQGERPPRNQVITLTMPYLIKYMENAVSYYEMAHKDVDIVLDYIYNSREEFLGSTRDYAEKLSLRIANGEVGDIVMIGGSGIELSSALASDAFLDLSDRLIGSPEYPNLIVPLFDGMRINGALRGIPLSYYGGLAWVGFDAELGRELGIEERSTLQWSEVLNLVPVIQERFPNRILFGSKLVAEDPWGRLGSSILYANVDSLIDFERKQIDLAQPWFTELLRQFKRYASSLVMTNFDEHSINADGLGNALFSSAVSLTGDLREDVSRYTKAALQRECKLISPFLGETDPNLTLMSRAVFAISANSSDKETAWEFLEFLLSPRVQYAVAADQYPVNRIAYEMVKDEAMAEKRDDAEYFMQEVIWLAERVTRSYDYGMPIRIELFKQIGRYMNDEITLEEALQEAENKIRILLNE
ncbi:MAG: ABC transporter substrate-binding protein [Bacillota bacterium]|nr:ABC transporter substrate-binding protein [Bacillota bacterium]